MPRLLVSRALMRPDRPTWTTERTAMQKRHFEALARELRDNRPTLTDYDGNALEFHVAIAMWHKDVASVASVCKHFNPQFDRDRFIAAALKVLFHMTATTKNIMERVVD